ncbi:uncharacterized protein LOC114465683 [Gouania willdenowi]|uniref:uncharacterized protein LOC114465683 n=1 Tax=Gouania willdenowi TaxID=441366 RepID=UPI001054366C|nr:uncharacterized protein LOC114465683 [Gouania willdenowi]
MAAETESSPKTVLTKPDSLVWSSTAVVTFHLIFCVLVIALTATGLILNDRNLECEASVEFASWQKLQITLVSSWAGLIFLACILVLLECWRRNGHTIKMIAGVTCVLTVIMVSSLIYLHKAETKEIQHFRERYLTFLPHMRRTKYVRNATCSLLTNVYSWQTQFQCCGLESHQDWNSFIPDSCLCNRGRSESGCVEFKHSLVYEKPCLPTVIDLLKTHNYPFWIIMIVWVSIVSSPLAITCLTLAGLIIWSFFFCMSWLMEDQIVWCKTCWRKKRVPVVFIRKENNNQALSRKQSSRDASGEHTNTEQEEEEQNTEDKPGVNPVKMITLPQLSRLQEGLDPPPVLHRVQNGPCMCILPPSTKIKDFYTVWIEEGSPLLPGDAILVDAHIPMKNCFWDKGHRYYDVNDIVWPKEPEKSEKSEKSEV